jgi:hypothetical protein
LILTPIAPERLPATLAGFAASLDDEAARAVFAAIAATSPERAEGALAEAQRQDAMALARSFGMGLVEGSAAAGFNWDGTRLRADTEAYVLLHEVAHFQLASPARRWSIDFGLGAGPDTSDVAAAERAAVLLGIERDREEATVSLLGILWEVSLRHPALASFLDQNWLEGAGGERAARHFMNVLRALRDGGFIDEAGAPTRRLRETPD